nr:uncharacterized protein LOC494401 isoform X1 [Ciona intestinalis]|eukprot:XP_018666934.1 uncharacterized protein LOC494401 isoform X1 [Ciona intestinalis]
MASMKSTKQLGSITFKRNMQRRIAERTLTFVLCVFIYYPFFIFGMLMTYLARLTCMFKIWTGIGYKEYGKLGNISRKNPISDIIEVSTKEELSFIKHRSPTYLYRMSVWTARELSKYLLRGQTTGLISEQDLCYSLLCSVFAHSLTWEKDSEMYRMKMEGFDDFYLFRGFYWDAREVWFSKDCTKMKLVFTGDREISWPCEGKQMAEWKLAKLHAQVCLTYYAPGLSHNHVHFVFPSSMTMVIKRYLKPTSFLFRFLKPFFQFTERINHQALNVCKATNNKRSILDRHFFFWQPIPITVEQFVEGVAKKCHQYYHSNHAQHKKEKETNQELPAHCNFPPPYVSDPKLQEIPYLRFLAVYYDVIRKFVAAVAPLIDRTEWESVSKIMETHVPGFRDASMVDCIASFVHQVAIVHYCDHETFLRFFARQFGCMAIRSPYEPWSNIYHWDTIVGENPEVKYVKEFRDNPVKLLRSRDIMRTRCFQNVFVDFIPDWSLDLRLISTKHKFNPQTEQSAIEASRQWKLNLKDLDSQLSQTEPPIVVPLPPPDAIDSYTESRGGAGEGELGRSTNMQLIPVNQMIRSVCF